MHGGILKYEKRRLPVILSAPYKEFFPVFLSPLKATGDEAGDFILNRVFGAQNTDMLCAKIEEFVVFLKMAVRKQNSMNI